MYLGYKLMWVLQLFINGKKFPQGYIQEPKWRAYVHDIISFLSSPQILRDLMLIDAETLFQVISVLFMRNSRPYQIVLLGRDDFVSLDPNHQATKYMTHVEFLKDMDAAILGPNSGLPESAVQQYLFFVAHIVSKDSRFNQVPREVYFRATKELLRYHDRYTEFNRNLQEMMGPKKEKPEEVTPSKQAEALAIVRRITQLQQSKYSLSHNSLAIIDAQQEQAAKLAAEELRYLQKTESDFLTLLRRCEPLTNMDEVQELIGIA